LFLDQTKKVVFFFSKRLFEKPDSVITTSFEDLNFCPKNLKPLPDSLKKLIESKTYANVATFMPDGSPQVTQTWVDHDGDTSPF
jgi:hypothetical protein